jgi:peptidoglycan/xylan/chitin deacetylase (PgdA/CDA1 family)
VSSALRGIVQGAVDSARLKTEEPGTLPNAGAYAGPRRLCILAYHEVVPEPSAYLYSVTSARFDEHLRLLDALRNNAQAEAPSSQVTFDDGHVTCYRYALPLLEQHRLSATFFVTTDWIGQRAEFMTWTHLEELAALGHRVQSHGCTHQLLTQCSDSELNEELRRSKLILEDKLGVAVDSISAPGGRWNRRTLRAARAAGYAQVYLSDPWMAPANCEGVRVLGRLMVHRQMDARRLRQLMEMSGAPLFLHRALYQAKEAAKAILGDAAYQRLWRFAARSNESHTAPEEKY